MQIMHGLTVTSFCLRQFA